MAIEYIKSLNFEMTDITHLSNEKSSVVTLYAKVNSISFNPTAIFRKLCDGEGFLLESVKGNEKSKIHSVIGFNPLFTVTVDKEIEINGKHKPILPAKGKSNDAVSYIQSLIDGIEFKSPGIPGFSGGIIGFFSYENSYSIHAVGDAKHHHSIPLASFISPGECVVYDHDEKTAFALSFILVNDGKITKEQIKSAANRLSKVIEAINVFSEEKTKISSSVSVPLSTPTKENFEELVKITKNHILNGEIFQTVISREFECQYEGDPFEIYRHLCMINQSPYMYYINFGSRQVIGASPEMLVQVKNRCVTTVPIAGTRKRGVNQKEDQKLAEELLKDEKERAEHTMLLDLARNDVGRVAKYGSVAIPEFMNVEKFSHVQHIVSVVSGELAENKTSFDAFRSCFPAGTVSGAPKVRAIQIISELEKTPRGLYAGAVGYIDFNGNMDFAIAIRTIIAEAGKLTYRTGAGIVADSVPENEYYETEKKAEGLVKAINLAVGEQL